MRIQLTTKEEITMKLTGGIFEYTLTPSDEIAIFEKKAEMDKLIRDIETLSLGLRMLNLFSYTDSVISDKFIDDFTKNQPVIYSEFDFKNLSPDEILNVCDALLDELKRTYQTGLINPIFYGNIGLLIYLAKGVLDKKITTSVPKNDLMYQLIDAGYEGLINEAFRRYNFNILTLTNGKWKPLHFSTSATSWIKQRILKDVSLESIISLPDGLKALGKKNQKFIDEADDENIDELENKLHIKDSDSPKIRKRKIEKNSQLLLKEVASLDTLMADNDFSYMIHGTEENPQNEYDEYEAKKQFASILKDNLTSQELMIFCYVYGYYDEHLGYNKQEIAYPIKDVAKTLGLKVQQVNAIIYGIKKQLRNKRSSFLAFKKWSGDFNVANDLNKWYYNQNLAYYLPMQIVMFKDNEYKIISNTTIQTLKQQANLDETFKQYVNDYQAKVITKKQLEKLEFYVVVDVYYNVLELKSLYNITDAYDLEHKWLKDNKDFIRITKSNNKKVMRYIVYSNKVLKSKILSQNELEELHKKYNEALRVLPLKD